MPKDMSSSPSFIEKYRFWLLVVTAAVFMELPIISVPFKWFESYFHEISHGLAALATGGDVVRIQLFLNGAGLCTTYGGSRFVISFMGYAGATFWGVLIYQLSNVRQGAAKVASSLLILMLLFSLLLWCKDVLTAGIIVVLIGILVAKIKLSSSALLPWLMQFISVIVVLNSVKSPLYLLDGRALGDGAALFEITLVPEIVWVGIWFFIGVLSLYLLAKNNKQNKPTSGV